MTRWTEARQDELRTLWNGGLQPKEIRRRMGLTLGQFNGKIRTLNLHPVARPGEKPVGELSASHPAVIGGRTLFPGSVQHPADAPRVLKPGLDSRKLGAVVTKGAWKGMSIFFLVLEERATCPRSCEQWRACYGNAFAKRMVAGGELEALIEVELAVLQARFPRGFVVRLHALGDFYSTAYVAQWRKWLKRYPALRVFGYTHWPAASPIGGALRRLTLAEWDRFAVRLSGDRIQQRGAIVVERASDARSAIVCPAQLGKTQSCGTCTLCWAPAAQHHTIAFIKHGPKWVGRPAKSVA